MLKIILPASKVASGLIGLCVGDALGVPVEGSSRVERMQAPVTGMYSRDIYNIWDQPPGTWSDDSSLTFCLTESLCKGFSLAAIAESFCRWYYRNAWTARGRVSDIGITTQTAIERLYRGVSPTEAGDSVERNDGNGSLMRILPLAYCHKTLDFNTLIQRVHQVSCLTHAHPHAQIACGIYISIAICLLEGAEPKTAYFKGLRNLEHIYRQAPYYSELIHFERVLGKEIATLPEKVVRSGNSAIDTLEAALWCLLNSSSYPEAVLKAVNLGGDADTTAAVTGGLAGIHYGIHNIPPEWIEAIANKEAIINLATRLEAAIYR